MKINLLEIKKWVLKNILKKKYIRIGHCINCGSCCRRIYITHNGEVIKKESDLKDLQKYGYYRDFIVIEENENGLLLKCKLLDDKTNLCKNHKYRYSICRKYPQEEIFKIGAQLATTCGYSFQPIDSFSKILKKEIKKIDRKNKEEDKKFKII